MRLPLLAFCLRRSTNSLVRLIILLSKLFSGSCRPVVKRVWLHRQSFVFFTAFVEAAENLVADETFRSVNYFHLLVVTYVLMQVCVTHQH